MPKNLQERIVKSFSERSFGAPFIFSPEDWKKGKGTREPADLVWACNQCVVLFYMRSRQKIHTDEYIFEERRREDIRHNFNQARGSIDEWRNDERTINGQNSYGSFSIKFSDYKYLGVISVIDCDKKFGQYHYDQEKELNVSFCATLPQTAVEILAKIGASIVDLLIILKRIKEIGKGDNDAKIDVIELILDYYQESEHYADPQKEWLNGSLDQNLYSIRKFLMNLRYPYQTTSLKLNSEHTSSHLTVS